LRNHGEEDREEDQVDNDPENKYNQLGDIHGSGGVPEPKRDGLEVAFQRYRIEEGCEESKVKAEKRTDIFREGGIFAIIPR
jgi:hypothetical protein